MLGDGDAVAVGVGEHAVGIGEDAVIFAVDIHTGGGGAVPFQCSGRGAQQVGGLGIEHLAVLQARLGLVKLAGREEVGNKARVLGGPGDLGLVGVGEEILENTDFAVHE